MKLFIRFILISTTILLFFSCSGKIITTNNGFSKNQFSKAYIISNEESRRKLPFVVPLPNVTIHGTTAAGKTKKIGNIEEVIKNELEKHGIEAIIATDNDEDIPEDIDFIVIYYDIWRWDFKNVLEYLEIVFLHTNGEDVLARSIYKIHASKEFHNFPTPKKEIPKMFNQLLSK